MHVFCLSRIINHIDAVLSTSPSLRAEQPIRPGVTVRAASSHVEVVFSIQAHQRGNSADFVDPVVILPSKK